jgi:hypothetical protein
MANFKTHTNFGLIIGVIVFIIFFTFIGNYNILLIAFLATILGSFLPDIDVDSGKSFRLIFTTLGILLAILSLLFIKENNVKIIKYYFAIPILTFVFVRYFVGYIFKKFTHHRGIWHSIPALLISSLITLQIANLFHIKILEQAIISFSIGLGYLSHLVLDEIYSVVDSNGIRFRPKKSLGTALKLKTNSRFINIVTYLILAILTLISLPLLEQILDKL